MNQAVIISNDSTQVERYSKYLESHGCRVERIGCASELRLRPLLNGPGAHQTKSTVRPGLFIIALDIETDKRAELANHLASSCELGGAAVIVVGSPAILEEYFKNPPTGLTFLSPDSSPSAIARVLDEALARIPAHDAESFPDVVFTLPDFLSREISRARRLDTEMALLLFECVSTDCWKGSLKDVLQSRILPDVEDALRQTLRETDTVVTLQDSGILIILPDTPRVALSRVETRLHDNLRPVLRGVLPEKGIYLQPITAWASFPADGFAWTQLLQEARTRLEQKRQAATGRKAA